MNTSLKTRIEKKAVIGKSWQTERDEWIMIYVTFKRGGGGRGRGSAEWEREECEIRSLLKVGKKKQRIFFSKSGHPFRISHFLPVIFLFVIFPDAI